MKLKLLLAAVASVFLAACEPPDVTSAERTIEEFSAVGTVREIDRPNRRFVLRIDGRVLTLRANEAVVAYDILEVGDRVRVGYTESLAVSMADPETPSERNVGAAEEIFVGDNTIGRGGAIVATSVVEFVSFDPSSNMAVLIDPDGNRFSVSVAREMRDFARSRTAGERILITYTAAAAVSLEIVETG